MRPAIAFIPAAGTAEADRSRKRATLFLEKLEVTQAVQRQPRDANIIPFRQFFQLCATN